MMDLLKLTLFCATIRSWSKPIFWNHDSFESQFFEIAVPRLRQGFQLALTELIES